MVDDVNKEAMNFIEEDEKDKDLGLMVSPNLGLLIKHYRTKVKGLSLNELEKVSGVSSSYICRLENNQRRSSSISIKKIFQLTGALSIPYDVLVATIAKNNDVDKRTDTITDVLIKNDYLINERALNSQTKEILIRLIEAITVAEWSQGSKVRELYEISELIDQLKEAM